MQSFGPIHDLARTRKGGEAQLQALLPTVKSATALARVKNDRVLAEMARCVFQAGFVWRVIDNKWDGFEAVFFGFDPQRLVLLSPEQVESIGQDARIVRNMQKIVATQRNAQYLLDVSREHRSFGRFAAGWPSSDLVGLFEHMRKHGARLGGMSGQRVLRNIGRDTFILTGDVVRALRGAGLELGDNPTSKRELQLIQATFNRWHEESGLPYAHLSRICACSVG